MGLAQSRARLAPRAAPSAPETRNLFVVVTTGSLTLFLELFTGSPHMCAEVGSRLHRRDEPWCLPRSLLRAAPESRGHVVPSDRGAVVFRPDGQGLSHQPWWKQPDGPRYDPESLCRAPESSQGELLGKLLEQAPGCPYQKCWVFLPLPCSWSRRPGLLGTPASE